jgi:hypothetical protein
MSLDIALHKKCLELKECQESAVRERGDCRLGVEREAWGSGERHMQKTHEGGRARAE